MSILDFLKKIKLPAFDDDFIEDPVDKAMADAPKIRGRVVSDPRGEMLAEEDESAAEWGLKELARNSDPCDIKYFPTPPFRE